VHALLGPNGSGKTSLMMTIMGYPAYKITSGQILFAGRDITYMGLTERARMGLGISHQRPPTISGVKLRQVLEYAMRENPDQKQQVEQFVEQAKMRDFLDRDINAGLSGGEIKRSELLQLLITRPRLVMLDEPDSGVDIEALDVVGTMLNTLFARDPNHPVKRRSGLIITHTGHILQYVDTDKAHILMNGRIGCSGNSHLIFQTVCNSGYEECVRCILRQEEEA
jgi:Fe-S cluster assembly ATP-binding protein